MSRTHNEVGEKFPEVSVVVVSYFTGPLLDRAIDSILDQDVSLELVIVNNGNPSDVAARLHELAASDGRVSVQSGHGNIGFARGCNLGAKQATGELLLFLNPDALLPRGALSGLVSEGRKLEHPWMLGAKLVNPDGSEQRGGRRESLTPWSAIVEGSQIYRVFPKSTSFARFNKNEESPPQETVPVPVISGACMMLSKDDYWSIGGMDEEYFLHVEDVDFCFRFRKAGGEVYFVPYVEVRHDVSSSRANSWSVEWYKTKGFLRYFWKNFRSEYNSFSLAAVSVCVAALFLVRSAAISVRHLFGSADS